MATQAVVGNPTEVYFSTENALFSSHYRDAIEQTSMEDGQLTPPPPPSPSPPPPPPAAVTLESRSRRSKLVPPPPQVEPYLNITPTVHDEKKKRKYEGVNEAFPSKRPKTSVPYEEVDGNILKKYNEDDSAIIVQINNCVARRAHYRSFTWHLAQVYPYANPYADRKHGLYPNLAAKEQRSELGSIQLRKPPPTLSIPSPTFACCFSQYRMGNTESQYYNAATYIDEEYLINSMEKDSYTQRLVYFARCLHTLCNALKNENMKQYKKIVFPKYIGSGLAGGKWEHYEEMINKFSIKVKQVRPDLAVHVVKKFYWNDQE